MPESRSSLPYNSRSDLFDAGGQAAYRADTFRRDSDWPQRDNSRGSSGRFGGPPYYGAGAGGPPGAVGNPQVRMSPSSDGRDWISSNAVLCPFSQQTGVTRREGLYTSGRSTGF